MAVISKTTILLHVVVTLCYAADYVIKIECQTDDECTKAIQAISQKFSSQSNATNNSTNITETQSQHALLHDFNECDNSLSFCSTRATCQNVFRTYSCECLRGFEDVNYLGNNCTDINECEDPSLNMCAENTTCVNEEGTYSCQCNFNTTIPPGSTCTSGGVVTNASIERETTAIPTQPTTAIPTQPTTAIPTQPTTAIPTQPTTAIPTQPTTAIPTQPTTAIPTQPTTAIPTQPTTAIPTQPTTAIPTQPTTAIPTQPTTAIPTQPTTAIPTQPRTTTPTRTTEQIRTTEQTRTTEQIRTTEQTRTTEQIRTTEQTRTTEQISLFTAGEENLTTAGANTTYVHAQERSSVSYTTESNDERSTQSNHQTTKDMSTSTVNTELSSSTDTKTSSTVITPATLSDATSATDSSTSTSSDIIIQSILDGSVDVGNISDEVITDVIAYLSSSIDGRRLDVGMATDILDIFNVFGSSERLFQPIVATEITKLVESLLNSMILNGGMFTYKTNSLIVAALDVNVSTYTPLSFSLTSGLNSTFNSSPSATIALPRHFLPSNIQQRISFVGFNDSRLFPSPHTASIRRPFHPDDVVGNTVINSAVIGSSVNGSTIHNLIEPVVLRFPTIVQQIPRIEMDNGTSIRRHLYNPTCVFFNYSLRDGLGDWSDSGCTTTTSSSGDVTCQCNHLTSFAVLMSVESKTDDQVLMILTCVGCGLSIVGLVASITTYSLFRHLRKHKSKQILLHFCVALCGVYIVYVLGIATSLPNNSSQCIASGFFLHFFTSATFAWMLVEVLDMYLMFVKVLSGVNTTVWKACLFGWGFPALLSLVTLGAHFGIQNSDPGNELRRMYPVYRETSICWLANLGLYWAFLLPMGIILVINVILFSVVLYHVTCKRAKTKLTRMRSNTRHVKARQHVLNATAILLLSGPTWVVGFFINIDPLEDGVVRRILAYIFVLLNAFQGLWVFIVFTLRPRAVRAAWMGLLCRKAGFDQVSKSGSVSWGRRGTKSTSSTFASRVNKRKSSADVSRNSTGMVTSVCITATNPDHAHQLVENNSTKTAPHLYRYQLESASNNKNQVSQNISCKPTKPDVNHDMNEQLNNRAIVDECSSVGSSMLCSDAS